MTVSLILITVASIILRYLASQAKLAFDARVRLLLPRGIEQNPVALLFREFPDRLPEFRSHALPMQALQLALDISSCAALLTGLWVWPPVFLEGLELAALQYAGLILVGLALTLDLVAFCRMAYGAWVPAAPSAPEDGEM